MNYLKIIARDTLVNSNRGKVSLLVENCIDSPVCIYRNKKLAKFSTLHPVEINSLNIAAAQCYENYNQSKTHGSDYSSAERPSENNHNSRSRWQNKINDLYSLLEINELVELSEVQRSEIKNSPTASVTTLGYIYLCDHRHLHRHRFPDTLMTK